MTKIIKALLGLTTLVALLAISAAPAFATYTSTTKELKGTGSAGKTTFTTGTLSVTCEKAEGTWKIAATGSKTINIFAEKWNNCKNNIFGGATVKACEFSVEQKAAETTNLLSNVITGCEIKALGCTITVPSAGNTGLKKVTQANVGATLEAKAEVVEILGTYKSCTLAEKEKTGKEVGTVLGTGVKAA
jgi:hypothetical protein